MSHFKFCYESHNLLKFTIESVLQILPLAFQ